MVKFKRKNGLLRKKRIIWVEQISNDEPQVLNKLTALFSMTVQQIHKENKDKLEVSVYEKSFDRVVKQAEEEIGELSPEVMQMLIIQHFNRRSHRSKIMVEPVVYHNIEGVPNPF